MGTSPELLIGTTRKSVTRLSGGSWLGAMSAEGCGLYEHVVRPATGEWFEGIWRGCDTALPGSRRHHPGRNEIPDSPRMDTWIPRRS